MLYQQLKKLQAIKNSYKRKEANNKLFSLITYLKENHELNLDNIKIASNIIQYIFFLISV